MHDDELGQRVDAPGGAKKRAGKSVHYPIPTHIAQLLVALAAPRPADSICDPCADDCALLAAAADYVRESFPASLRDELEREHFHTHMFHGFGTDQAMLAAGAQRVGEHGPEHADIRAFDVTADALGEHAAAYSLVLCRVPFNVTVEYASIAKDLLRHLRTKRMELLLLARITQLLSPGGRAALIVPDGLLSGATKAHLSVRSKLVEEHKVEAVIRLPAGVFRPHSGAAAAILLFARAASGGTGNVWFYDVAADGFTLDDRRAPLLSQARLGVRPHGALAPNEHARNNLPDLLERWQRFRTQPPASEESRNAQSFCVSKTEIAAQGYDLSLDRYKLATPTHIESRRPHEILAELAGLEAEIFQGMKDIVGMLK